MKNGTILILALLLSAPAFGMQVVRNCGITIEHSMLPLLLSKKIKLDSVVLHNSLRLARGYSSNETEQQQKKIKLKLEKKIKITEGVGNFLLGSSAIAVSVIGCVSAGVLGAEAILHLLILFYEYPVKTSLGLVGTGSVGFGFMLIADKYKEKLAGLKIGPIKGSLLKRSDQEKPKNT